MKTREKTKKQLIDELADMHKKISELETLVIQHKQDDSARRSEELFKVIVENALEFITIIDGDGIIRYESPSVERKTGYRAEDLIGKRIFDIIHPDDLPRAIDAYNRTIQYPDKIQSVELRTRDSHGTWRVLEASVRNLLSNPMVKGIVIHSYDITEQRQAETQLKESENLYRTLTEYSLTGIYLFKEGHYLFANEMFHKISGYSWDDLKSMDPVDLLAPEYRKKASERLKRRFAGEDVPPDYETQILRKDGAIRDAHIKAKRIIYKDEPAVLGNIIDTTETRRMEEALNVERQRFQVLCERSPVGVMMVAEDGTLKYLNPTFSKLFGYDLSDIPDGRTWLRKAYPDPAYRHQVVSTWISELESFKKKERTHRVFNVTCKDGTEKTVDFASVQLEAGEYSVLCEDITERKRAEEAIKKSEMKYRKLHESMMDGFIFVSMDGMIKEFNESYREMLGYTPEELIKLTYQDLTPEKWHTFEQNIIEQQILTRGYSKVYEKEYRKKDGTIFPVELRTFLIKDETGGNMGMWAIVRDITERKQAEESLHRSEEKFRELYDNAPVGYHEYDSEGRITSVNLTDLEMLGYTREELVGQPIWKFNVNEETVCEQVMAKLAGTLPLTKELERIYRRKDGTTFPVLIEDRLILDENRSIKGIRCTIQDITERKRAEEALRESEEKYRLVVENAKEAILVAQDRVLKFVNRSTEEMTGYSREELTSRPFADFIHPDDQEMMIRNYQKRLGGEALPPVYSFRVIRRDGESRWAEANAVVITWNGRPAALYFVRDITERKRAEQALRESEERFRGLSNASLEGIMVHDHGVIMDANRAFVQMFGYQGPDELLGTNGLDILFTPESRVRIEQRMASGETGPSEITCVRKDGSAFAAETDSRTVKYLGHDARIVSCRDITERKRTEEALRDSERRLKIILQGSPISAFILDKEHNVIHWNKALEELSGIKAEEVIGTKEHWKPFYREERPCLADLLIDGRVEEIPQWYPGKWVKSKLVEGAYEATDFFPALGDGGRWMHFTAATLRDFSEKIVGVIETLEDITERKEAEDRLRESESRFRDLVENALTGIYIMQEGRIVYKNPEQDRIFGPLPRPYNFNDFRNVHPEDVEKIKELYEKMMSGEISNFDVDMRFFPGGEMEDTVDMKWVQSRAREIEYQGRKAILINMMDVSRARELEHLMRIDDKMTSLGRAAAGIIHELRNPLSGINVYLTALKKIYNQPDKIESKSLEKVNEIIEKMQSASNKIESVIKRVMDFSKPSIPRLALTNINHSIQEAIGLAAATLRKYGIRIETSLRDDLPQCFTDSHLIEEVILNLIMNASQAMEKTAGEKIIEVASSAEENSVLIRVADSGPGVPPVLRKKIFDPFFTTKKDSSGIGLSVCYRIMADHGGSLNVLTSKWGGAEFRVEIPIEKRKDAR